MGVRSKTDIALMYMEDLVRPDILQEVQRRLCLLYTSIALLTDVSAKQREPEELDSLPSMAVYLVQRGDDLWSIAKHYNTTMDTVAKLNSIDPQGTLKEGTPLIMVKEA